GRPVPVGGAAEAMRGGPCYEVEFSDGEIIVADGQHQWLTWTRRARRYDAQTRGHAREFANPVPPEVVTTEQIARTLRCPTADRRPNHAVCMPRPLDLPDADLPIPPYALGAWLGDGASASARVTSFDPEIVMHVEASGLAAGPQGAPYYRMACPATPHGSVQAVLRTLGVLANKHLPLRYLRSSEAQRRAPLSRTLA